MVVALLLLVSGQAYADTVGELVEIQTQTTLTKAKVRLATAQRQLEDKGETGQVVNAQEQVFAMPVPATPPTITQPVPPMVRAIYGAGDEMTTIFLFLGGYGVDTASGAELLGNYHVESVSLDQVVLADKDGNHAPVGSSSVTPIQAASSAQGASVPPVLPGAVPQPFVQ